MVFSNTWFPTERNSGYKYLIYIYLNKLNRINLIFLKDWIKSGWITPVRNQQKCSNCYAFAATASIEASLWLKYKINVTLSPQQLTDCSTNYKNVGCNGGLVAYSFGYINDVGVIEDKYYTYIGKSVISFVFT